MRDADGRAQPEHVQNEMRHGVSETSGRTTRFNCEGYRFSPHCGCLDTVLLVTLW